MTFREESSLEVGGPYSAPGEGMGGTKYSVFTTELGPGENLVLG